MTFSWCSHRALGVLRHSLSRYYSSANAPIVLRPYQKECLDSCIEALTSGSTRIGVSLPTGSGKTTVFVNLLSRIATAKQSPKATRSLIIVNSVELAHQSANQVARMFPSWSVEIEQGTKYKASGEADVTVATIQTLLSETRRQKFDPRFTRAIIVDEAHHAAAPSYRRVLSHFDPNIKNPDDPDGKRPALPHHVPIFGFSATFSRHDGLALGSVFERIVYHQDFLQMIKDEWLCSVRFTSVKADLNLKNVTVNSANGDFSARSLSDVINTDTVNHLVVQSWLDRAGERKSTLVFCVSVAHVHALTQVFRGFGVDARYIYADTPAKERQTIIADFKAGLYPVLVNCAILTEGADVPNIDCVVVARPTRSRNVFAQMIGRGMRLSPGTGKKDCHIIDFVDSTTSVAGVVCAPSLFGLDPLEIQVECMTSEELEVAAKASIDRVDTNDNIPAPKSVTYTDFENPFALVNDASGAPHITQLSSMNWVGCGGDIYVLECMGRGFIRIERAPSSDGEEPHFIAHYTPAILDKGTAKVLKMSPYRQSKPILTAVNLGDAVRGCDTYATTKVLFGHMVLGIRRTAKWRKDPATDGQKSFVANRWNTRGKHDDTEAWELEKNAKLATLTKGQAGNMITRLKHGAQARYETQFKTANKAVKVKEAETLRQARTEVKVGPLVA